MSAKQMPEIYTLPLFPLHTVLFPQFPLKLHIFEDRYKAMVAGCIARKEPFGVLLIRAGEEVGQPAVPFEVGCLAHILSVERLPNGEMLLLVAGESRFRVLEYAPAELPYLVGRVETLEDASVRKELTAELAAEARSCFVRYLETVAARAGSSLPELELPEDPAMLSFCIGAIAMVGNREKQRLLEMLDPIERLRAEVEILRRETEREDRPDPATESGPQTGVGVLVARPLQVNASHWQQYRNDARN